MGVFLLLVAGAGILFLNFSWYSLSMEEMLFHLRVSLRGTNMTIVWQFLLICVLPALALSLFWCLTRRTRKKPFRVMHRILTGLTFVFFLFCLVFGGIRFHALQFIRGQFITSDFIDTHAVDPEKAEITFPEKKRNLIYIYLESMEITYADPENGGAFPENVIPDLTKLAEENEDFSGNSGKLNGGIALEDTTWTVGAMFGQTSGLPLKVPMGQNQMVYMDAFFPGATTLGDILAENGYRNVLMLGSDADFGGRRKYFTQHGNYEICDYPWAKKTKRIPEDYHVWWGYEDRKLFQYARQKVQELSRGDQPYNLTLLTVDTHFEDGHLCPLCPDTFGDNRYANIMDCSSRQVCRFIRWLRDYGYLDHTTVVISGDHPTMDRDFCKDVDENYRRRVYTCYINADAVPADPDRVRKYSTLDDFPTTLAALGCRIRGDRLGLGTNLFSDRDTLVEKYGTDRVNREFTYKSKYMIRLYNGD